MADAIQIYSSHRTVKNKNGCWPSLHLPVVVFLSSFTDHLSHVRGSCFDRASCPSRRSFPGMRSGVSCSQDSLLANVVIATRTSYQAQVQYMLSWVGKTISYSLTSIPWRLVRCTVDNDFLVGAIHSENVDPNYLNHLCTITGRDYVAWFCCRTCHSMQHIYQETRYSMG